MNSEILPYKRLGKESSETTLIFLYGAGMTKEGMVPFVNYFESYNCIIFDFPSHGEAKVCKKDSIVSFSDQIEKSIMYLQDKNIISKKIVLLGYSMGGAAALHIAFNKKVDLSAMVLLSSGADLKDYSPIVNSLHGVTFETYNRADILERLFGNVVTEERKAEIKKLFIKNSSEAEVSYNDLMICSKYNELKRCNEIHIPTFLVHGNDDAVVSPMSTIITSQNIKNSELMILPYGGHALIFEDSECISEKIIFFIQKVLS